MTKKILSILLTALFALSTMGISCKDRRKTALRHTSAIVSGLATLQTTTIQAEAGGDLSLDESRIIITHTVISLRYARELNNILEVADKWDDGTRERVFTIGGQLSASLEELNKNGLLGVKNEPQKENLSLIFKGIRASLDALRGVL